MKIAAIKVINEASASEFEAALMEAVKKLQEKELEVTINNPHFITSEIFNYVAVVEGRNPKS